MNRIFSIIILIGLLQSAYGQEMLTTAERTNYQKTSTYSEVMTFISTLDNNSPYARLDTIAISTEGRAVPLLIIANPMPENSNSIKSDKRLVIYLQANIHAGEVEGKEATQMLARELLKNPESDILKNLIVLINPILNPDGNEKFSEKNRTNQNGPASVGVRPNGQMLDLNRDAMKLETPEIRGVVKNVLNKWDPAISVDIHTTNGSFHEEPCTFTWQMNPNGNRNLINYMRDRMMPSVHRNLWNKYDVENIFYGEFVDRMHMDKGWISYASEARFLWNYIGIRNRLSILNENYVYADFKTRVNGSYQLLNSILEYAVNHSKEIKELLRNADKAGAGDSLAIHYKGIPTPEKITIKAYETDTIPGIKGYWRFKRSDRKRMVTVDYIADWVATESIKIPSFYIIDLTDPAIVEILKFHGIKVEQLKEAKSFKAEQFNIQSLKPADRLFQGHYLNTIEGSYGEVEKTFPAGTCLVYTNQPLGNLAAYLLEPQADDGLLKWNYFDKYLAPQWGTRFYPYPVYRVND